MPALKLTTDEATATVLHLDSLVGVTAGLRELENDVVHRGSLGHLPMNTNGAKTSISHWISYALYNDSRRSCRHSGRIDDHVLDGAITELLVNPCPSNL